MRIIAILTDFGIKDEYVGVIKGVISRISPGARIIDISHQVQKHQIKQGAYLLLRVVNYFPKETIYLGVVDPGVGTQRRGILIEAEGAWFIGPDNGLLVPAASKLGIKRVIELAKQDYWLKPASSTFHGRDIFAPVAGWLARGVKPTSFGKVIKKWVSLELAQPRIKADIIFGEILHIDNFGNLITNIPTEMFERNEEIQVAIKNMTFETKIRESYGEVKRGELIVLVGSSSFLEIAKNQESATKYFDAKEGVEIRIKKIN
jgi:hypothetical protein